MAPGKKNEFPYRARGTSVRSLGKKLGYKQATVLSHIAHGRVAVPMKRAADIALVVELPPEDFLSAAVEQRTPTAAEYLGGRDRGFGFELGLISGQSLDQLNDEQKQVAREVVADERPTRRWLSLAELPAIMLLRELRPNITQSGLSSKDRLAIEQALRPPGKL
jgi:hypothetical protein